jgi:hypothetical protein
MRRSLKAPASEGSLVTPSSTIPNPIVNDLNIALANFLAWVGGPKLGSLGPGVLQLLGTLNGTDNGVCLTTPWPDELDVLNKAGTALGAVVAGNVAGLMFYHCDATGEQLDLMNLARFSRKTLDLSLSTKQTLYTVPTGKVCIPLFVILRAVSAALDAGCAVGVGFDASAANFVSAVTIGANLSGSTKALRLEPSGAASYVVGAADDVLGLKASTPNATAKTVTAETFGYVY